MQAPPLGSSSVTLRTHSSFTCKHFGWQSTAVFFFWPSQIFSSLLLFSCKCSFFGGTRCDTAEGLGIRSSSGRGQHMFIAFIASLALLCRRTLCLADFGSLTLVDASSGRPHTGSSSHGSRPILELWSDTVMSYPHPWYYVSICIHVSGFWDVAVVEWLAKVPATWDVSRLCVLHGCSFIMSM